MLCGALVELVDVGAAVRCGALLGESRRVLLRQALRKSPGRANLGCHSLARTRVLRCQLVSLLCFEHYELLIGTR